MRRARVIFSMIVLLSCGVARGDDMIYAYEGEVMPWLDGWIGQPCNGPCSSHLQDGHFVLVFKSPWTAPYRHRITVPPESDPPSLWVEWNFRSNFLLGPVFFGCDVFFLIDYASLGDGTYMYSDAAISWSGDDYVLELEPEEFHTYRFESPDGMNYSFSVDGIVYMVGFRDSQYNGYSSVYFNGNGGCTGDEDFPVVDEFDFVRYGTLADGERIVGSNPPGGSVDARAYAPLDRFLITFDQPGYVYIDDAGVLVNAPARPEVIATRRRDNGPLNEVEIVLDRPIPLGRTTFFYFATGSPTPQVVSFTFARGDTDGDGDADLADFSYFQSCFGPTSPCPLLGKEGGSNSGPVAEKCGPCLVLDGDADGAVNALDFAAFLDVLGDP